MSDTQFIFIFMALGCVLGMAISFLWFVQYAIDAERYRWLRDRPATLVAHDAISRWLLMRPFGSCDLDAIVDRGMGKAVDDEDGQ